MASSIPDQRLIDLHAQGLGASEIARRVGLTKQTVSQRCKRLGLKFPQGQMNRTGFRSYAFPWTASAGRDDSWAA